MLTHPLHHFYGSSSQGRVSWSPSQEGQGIYIFQGLAVMTSEPHSSQTCGPFILFLHRIIPRHSHVEVLRCPVRPVLDMAYTVMYMDICRYGNDQTHIYIYISYIGGFSVSYAGYPYCYLLGKTSLTSGNSTHTITQHRMRCTTVVTLPKIPRYGRESEVVSSPSRRVAQYGDNTADYPLLSLVC